MAAQDSARRGTWKYQTRLIKEYDERFHHILGYRRMTSWINHFNHARYSKNRVHRIMKKLGIHSVIRKKKKKYTYAKPDETAENILQRDFYTSAPNQKWATDVMEFKVPGEKKKLYLSAIIDLYDDILWHMSSVQEMITGWYLRHLKKQLRLSPMPGRFFIQTVDSNTPAGCSRRNLRNRKWCSPCPGLGTALTMGQQRGSGESLKPKCIRCTK